VATTTVPMMFGMMWLHDDPPAAGSDCLSRDDVVPDPKRQRVSVDERSPPNWPAVPRMSMRSTGRLR
jgi:hypothetical protein